VPVLVLLAVAGMLGVVAVVANMLGDSPSTNPGAAPSASTGGALPGLTGALPTTEPDSIQPGGPPPDGLAFTAAVLSPSTIEVVETVRWPDGGPATIGLELSEEAASAGGLAIALRPTIESLQVSVDGSPVLVTPREGSANSWVITPPTGAAPSVMEVRYLLDGAIVRSVPSTPGRALAVLTPISTGAIGDLPITMAISTASVLTVYCPASASQDAIMCGRLDGDRWTVALPPGLPLVVAQLDLPALT